MGNFSTAELQILRGAMVLALGVAGLVTANEKRAAYADLLGKIDSEIRVRGKLPDENKPDDETGGIGF